MLTLNALTAAQGLVIPMPCEMLGHRGVGPLQRRGEARTGRADLVVARLESGEREGASYTFAELDRKARAIGSRLAALGESGLPFSEEVGHDGRLYHAGIL